MRLHLQLLRSAPRGTASPPEHVEVPVTPVVTRIRDAAGRVWRVIDIEADLADDAGARMIAYVLPGDPSGPPPPPPHAALLGAADKHALTVQQAASNAGEMLRVAGASPEMVAAVQRLDGIKAAILWTMTDRDLYQTEPLLSLAQLLTLAHDAKP